MQRTLLSRNLVRRSIPLAMCGAASLVPKSNYSFTTQSACVTASFCFQEPRRCYSGGHEEEQPARTGQYLLDKNDVLTRVLEVVKNFEKVDAAKVTPESHFVNDLGLNSLDVVEVVFAIEQEFILDIPDHDAEKLQSIPETVEYIAQNPMAK